MRAADGLRLDINAESVSSSSTLIIGELIEHYRRTELAKSNSKTARTKQKIGWHSFRRTLATLLQSSGAPVKAAQKLMRQ
jgi:site-specific recombinase XerD